MGAPELSQSQSKRTWIGHHRTITIGPIVKSWSHRIMKSLGDKPMRALVFVCIIEEVAHAHVQNRSS